MHETRNKPFGDHCCLRRSGHAGCNTHPTHLTYLTSHTILNRETNMQPVPAGSCQVQLRCRAQGWAQPQMHNVLQLLHQTLDKHIRPSMHAPKRHHCADQPKIMVWNASAMRTQQAPVTSLGQQGSNWGNWQQHKPPLLPKDSASSTNCSPAATVHNSHHHLNAE